MADEAWSEYRMLVLAELKRLKESIDGLSVQVSNIANRLAVTELELKLKSGLWGALAGAVPSAIAIIWILTKD